MTVLPNWSFASNEIGKREVGKGEREVETAIFSSKQLNNLRFPTTRERERVDKRQHQYLLVKSNLPTTTDGSINNPQDTEKETVHSRLTRHETGRQEFEQIDGPLSLRGGEISKEQD